MNRTAEKIRSRNLQEYLRDNGIKVSHQRLIIFKYLLDQETHPSAHKIYEDLFPAIPTLSKTTVYNTMKLFVERGLVEEITIEGSESRYDINDPSHGHFKCDRCGRLFDIPLESSRYSPELPAGFSMKEFHVHFRGTCAACA